MKKNLSALFAAALLFPTICSSIILELDTMKNLEQYVESGTLVLIDLDHTLFEGTTSWGHASWYYYEIEKGIAEGLEHGDSVAKFYPEWIPSQSACQVKPLEESTPQVIQTLQDRGITVMGLTHRQPVISPQTLDQIDSIGVDFERNTIRERELTLPFPHPPKYIEGVLFVAEYNGKGEVLGAFLNTINYRPDKVVFVDDKISHLKSVENEMKAMGIDYTGLHYRVYEKHPMIFDREVLRVQKNMYHAILSNEAAECLLYCD